LRRLHSAPRRVEHGARLLTRLSSRRCNPAVALGCAQIGFDENRPANFGVVKALALVALVAVAICGAGAARMLPVTLVAHPQIAAPMYTGSVPERTYILQGVATGARAGDAVDILYKTCGPGTLGFTVFDSTRTAAGGSFSSLPVGGGLWRVRWNGVLSNVVLARSYLVPNYYRLRRGIFYVELYTGSGGQNLGGHFVELQRHNANDQWVRVGRARLRLVPLQRARRGSLKPYYAAQFRVRTRGLRLRVYVPAATASPCYLPGWTIPTTS
jgi:hypothetical protein